MPPFERTAADYPMSDAFDRLCIKYAPMPVARLRKCMTTGTCKYCPLGARFAASQLFDALLQSGRHDNLEVRTRCPVSELVLDGKKRVIGVRYFNADTGRTATAYAGRVVVCSGAYESPKILLRSRNTDWPKGVGNDHDLVGKHLISHPFLFARGTMAENKHSLQQELDFPTLMSRHYDTPEFQKEGKLFLFRDRSKPRVDLAGEMAKGLRREAIKAKILGPTEWEIQGLMEEFANPNNRVEMGAGLNRLGLPQTRVYFARAEGFQEAADAHLERMKVVLKEMGLTLGEAGVLPQRGDHAASTCRMARTPEEGVVDENLRVHGTDNLFVCSNAVFPSGAAVNPTLTVTALALRLGDHLRKRRV